MKPASKLVRQEDHEPSQLEAPRCAAGLTNEQLQHKHEQPPLATRLAARRMGRLRPQREENRSEHMPAIGPEDVLTCVAIMLVASAVGRGQTSCVAPQIIT